jgi:hypothetical protein
LIPNIVAFAFCCNASMSSRIMLKSCWTSNTFA